MENKTNYTFLNREEMMKEKFEFVNDKYEGFYRYKLPNEKTVTFLQSMSGRDETGVTILVEAYNKTNNIYVEWINSFLSQVCSPDIVCHDAEYENEYVLSCGTITNDSWLEFYKDIIFNRRKIGDSIEEIYKKSDHEKYNGDSEENIITIAYGLRSELCNINNIINSVLSVCHDTKEDKELVKQVTLEYLEKLSKIREVFINREKNKGE